MRPGKRRRDRVPAKGKGLGDVSRDGPSSWGKGIGGKWSRKSWFRLKEDAYRTQRIWKQRDHFFKKGRSKEKNGKAHSKRPGGTTSVKSEKGRYRGKTSTGRGGHGKSSMSGHAQKTEEDNGR